MIKNRLKKDRFVFFLSLGLCFNSSVSAKITHLEHEHPTATLLIGINYENSSSELSNCINDIDHVWEKLLAPQMKASEEFKILMSDKNLGTPFYPTKHNILNQLSLFAELVNQTKKGYFHYSGHGTRMKDLSGDEKDGYDEALVPLDYEKSGFLLDDDLYEGFIKKLDRDTEVFITSDCCHSGTIMDLPFKWDELGIKTTESLSHAKASKNLSKVVMLSGCKDTQTSADGGEITVDEEGSGALTGAFLAVLAKHHYVITYRELLIEINHMLKHYGFSQRPQLSSTKNLNLDDLCYFNANQLVLTH